MGFPPILVLLVFLRCDLSLERSLACCLIPLYVLRSPTSYLFMFCRDFDSVAASGTSLKVDMVTEMERATDVVSLLEELGFGCTFNVDHCKEILSLGGPLKEDDVARILGTVAHTAKGLEESQSIHGAFYNTLCSGELGNPMKLTSWNVDVILDAIKQLVHDSNLSQCSDA